MSSTHSWAEFAASYALDALDADERTSFETHLATCASCRADVQSYREVAAAMTETVPQRQAPRELRAKILKEARSVRPIASAPSVAQSPPLDVRSRTPWLATAAAAIVAVAMGALYLNERSEHNGVRSASAEAHSQLANAQQRIAENDSIIAALLAPDVETATLASEGRPPSARLYHNRARNVVVVTAFELPPAAAGRTYQLWGISGSQAVSLGTFNTDANRRAVVSFKVPLGARYQLSGITDEPAGGSPAPTSAPFLVGAWSTP